MGTHYSDPIFLIDRTEVKIATGSRGNHSDGESQTINVFDHGHNEGNYQEVYRIGDSSQYVTPSDLLTDARNIHELDRYLIARGAIKEGGRAKL